MNTLDRITIEEAKQIISDKEGIKVLKKSEPIFRIVSDFIETSETDELVDIEIALRQCERTGFFRK